MDTRTTAREWWRFGSVYFFVALIHLRAKLAVTPSFFDGTLEHNHALLRLFQFTNNEQSRLLQFYIPETVQRLTGMTISSAYVLQRWAFLLAALLCFHGWLRKWFTAGGAFAGVMALCAVLPLTYMDDLQESSSLLMLTFLLALWAIREGRTGVYTLVLAIGALNNETMLVLPAVYFFCNFRSWQPAPLLRLSAMTALTSVPSYALVAVIRHITRDNPHLGPRWQWPDNWHDIAMGLAASPLDWFAARGLYPVFLFGALWAFALVDWRAKPQFLRRAALVVPLFVLAHLVTGVIQEVRQMVPLAYLVIPLALFTLAPDSVTAPSRSEPLPARGA